MIICPILGILRRGGRWIVKCEDFYRLVENLKKFLIIGANGFVGKSMTKYLKEQGGYQVFRAIHSGFSEKQNQFIGDICNRSFVNRMITDTKPDYIVNLCGINSLGQAEKNPQLAFNINVGGTINVLDAVRYNSPHTKILLVGSSEEYALAGSTLKEDNLLKPRNVYGLSKKWQEEIGIKYADDYGLKVICVRSFNHTGIYQSNMAVIPSFCQQVARIDKNGKKGTIRVGNLNVYRDISDVRDVIEAYIMLLESDISTGVYNVCSGEQVLLRKLLSEIIGFSESNIRIEVDTTRYRDGEPVFIKGDNHKLVKDTAWKKKYDIRTTIREIYDYYRAEE